MHASKIENHLKIGPKSWKMTGPDENYVNTV